MSLRLFIALHLEDAIRIRLSRIQDDLRAADGAAEVRWVNPDAIHLTLRFLGETPEPAVPGLVAALGTKLVDQHQLRLGLAGLGGFPNLKRPRVIWVGLQGDLEPLGILQQQVEAAMTMSGRPAEDRPFQPHLTLGRARHPVHRLAPELAAAIESARIEPGSEAHSQVALFRSHLGHTGSRNEVMAQWDLGA